MNYTFCLTVHDSNHDLQEYNNISYFQFSIPTLIYYPMMRNGYLFQLRINDYYADYVLCSFVAKSNIRKSLINN